MIAAQPASVAAAAARPSITSLVRRVTRATDAQLTFVTRLMNGHGDEDVTFQNRTDSTYEVLAHGRIDSEATQVATRFDRYVRSHGCLQRVEARKIRALSPGDNETPLLPTPQRGVHYTSTPGGLRWSYTVHGYRSFGSADYNRRFEISSGTLHGILGGPYTWHFTQSYPASLPARDFAVPADLCASRH